MYTAILSYSRLQKGEPLKAPGSKQRDFVLKGICEVYKASWTLLALYTPFSNTVRALQSWIYVKTLPQKPNASDRLVVWPLILCPSTKLILHAVACQLHLASLVWLHIVDRQYFDWEYTVAARCTLLISFPTDPDCCIGSVDWVGICLVLALLKMVTIWVIQFWHEQENFFFKWQVCEHQ